MTMRNKFPIQAFYTVLKKWSDLNFWLFFIMISCSRTRNKTKILILKNSRESIIGRYLTPSMRGLIYLDLTTKSWVHLILGPVQKRLSLTISSLRNAWTSSSRKSRCRWWSGAQGYVGSLSQRQCTGLRVTMKTISQFNLFSKNTPLRLIASF